MRKPDVDSRALRDLLGRVFPGRPFAVARTAGGTSTQVYRLTGANVTYFLRIAEDADDRLGAEALVHQILAGRGVRVPRVVHYESFDRALDRSVMVTTAIPGNPLTAGCSLDMAQNVLRAAGRDLALVNEVAVAGFGFVRRNEPWPTSLEGDAPSATAFVEHDLEDDLLATYEMLPGPITASVRQLYADWTGRLAVQPAHLAHGDFDTTHVFSDAGGYSGLIDFGEIRGADRMYDLGHFALHDGVRLPPGLLRPMLVGYRDVVAVSEEDEARIWLWAALIGVRFLSRNRGRLSPYHQRHAVERIAHAVKTLAT